MASHTSYPAEPSALRNESGPAGMNDQIQVDTQVDQKSVPIEPPAATQELKLRTPLPKLQLFLVCLIQFAEPLTASVIYPFVNQFVRATGITQGDDRKTGYYAGVIESVFFAAEALTAFQWGWLSDRFGRRIVLLLGPLGLSFAMIAFGCSTSYWSMILARCLQGICNGNIGVSKTVMVELTDATNMGDAFALMPIMWSAGITLGPIIGGILSNPATRWPHSFGYFFVTHPYLLPCLVTGIVAFLTFVIGFVRLKETRPPRRRALERLREDDRQRRASEVSHTDSKDVPSDHKEGLDDGTNPSTSPALSKSPSSESITLLSVLKNRRMQFILTNYTIFALIDMCYAVLIPLMWSTPVGIGGLGLSSFQIGLTMGIWGFLNAVVQINATGRVIRKFGGASVFKFAFVFYLLCFATFPLSTFLAERHGRVYVGSWLVIASQLFFQVFAYMSYASIQVVIAEATPKHLIGSVNGFAQMAGCVMRTVAPTFSSSLFSVSIRQEIIHGYLVYVIIYIICVIGIGCSTTLNNRNHEPEASA